eukprot:15471465-Alexandrium_andersonii.AAC.1
MELHGLRGVSPADQDAIRVVGDRRSQLVDCELARHRHAEQVNQVASRSTCSGGCAMKKQCVMYNASGMYRYCLLVFSSFFHNRPRLCARQRNTTLNGR